MKPDAIYIRTSPTCPDNQRERLEKQLGKSERPRQWYEDAGCDLMDERPAWLHLVDDIRAGRVGRLFFCALQVLGFRKMDELAELILLCEKQGVEWRGPEPTFRSAAHAAGGFRRERVSAGIADRKSQGKPQGGDRRSGTRGISEGAVRKILELHEQGVNDSEIARRVGHDRRTVKSVWERGG